MHFPEAVTSIQGVTVAADDILYVSSGHEVYTYTLPRDSWIKLPSHTCSNFGMVVLIGTLTTIGGCMEGIPTNALYSLIQNSWVKVFPPMPTKRMYPAVVNTSTNLVVAGGKSESQSSLFTVEILDIKNRQWFSASHLPLATSHPEMVECNGYIYCSEGNSLFSCSQDDLLASCYTSSNDDSVWSALAKIPVPNDCSLTVVKECVLAVGGAEDTFGDNMTNAIHSYNVATDTWSVMDQMPTARSHALTALLPNNELVVIGGYLSFDHPCSIVEILRS